MEDPGKGGLACPGTISRKIEKGPYHSNWEKSSDGSFDGDQHGRGEDTRKSSSSCGGLDNLKKKSGIGGNLLSRNLTRCNENDNLRAQSNTSRGVGVK